MPLETFIEASNKATNASELVTVWQKSMAVLGFDRVLFSLLTDHEIINRRTGHIVAVNFPKEWLARYFAGGFELMRQHMFAAEGAFSWQKLKRGPKIDTSLFGADGSIGLYHGIGIPLRGPRGIMAGITTAGSQACLAPCEDALDYVGLISHQFYKSFLKMEMRSSLQKHVSFTEREKQVLTWYSAGKTNIEIGLIMKVTPHTVGFHLKSVFLKLGVQNGRAAVLKAASMGLIFPQSSGHERIAG